MPKTVRVPEKPTPDTFAWPTDLPSDDGVPMDTPWHRDQMYLLIDSIETHWAGRKDFYSGGNMFLYFSRQYVKNTDFRGPDFFVVKDTDHDRERKYWALWEENNRAPAVIVELLSDTTRDTDLGEKKDIYERTLPTPEYFCFDPDDWSLRGWRLTNGKYVAIKPDKAGRLRSEELGLSFGLWEGHYLGHTNRWFRLFTKQGRLVPTAAEAAAAGGSRSAAREKARADQEASRADQAEAEVARLKQELAQARRKNGKHK